MMQLKVDMHIHSDHSIDSKSSINEMCLSAIEKGFEYICFAEHFDLNPRDDGYAFYNYENYVRDINVAREKYSSGLTILKGIEFGEPHRYPRIFEKILKNGYDFVLGSIHWIGEHWVGEKFFQENYRLEKIYEMHYKETLEMVRFGGFDSLAHIDFPKRYLPGQYEPVAEIESILQAIIKRDIALELNSSPIRKGLAEICPSNKILDLYIHNGGLKVTLASDAHVPQQIGENFIYMTAALEKYGLKNVIYIDRQETNLAGA